MNRRAGMSLIETLFAVFVLLAAFTIFGTLFQWVMTSSKRGDQAATAARLAHNRLEELRQWSEQPAGASDNFRAGNWTGWATPSEVEPGYTVQIDRVANQCYSPSTSLEAGFARPREMSNSCHRVRVRVHWGQQNYDLYSQLAAPPVKPLIVPSRLLPPSVPDVLAAASWPSAAAFDRQALLKLMEAAIQGAAVVRRV